MTDDRPQPANTGAAEQAMRAHLDVWARRRWGAGVRLLHELALGERRIDIVVVGDNDLIGIEVKGPHDRIDEIRMPAQLREFGFYLPELWLAVAPRWENHRIVRRQQVNLLVVGGADAPVKECPARRLRDVHRDDLCCSRVLELLWQAEAAAIAQRTGVIPGPVLSDAPKRKITAMLARLLTGHEIVKQVCLELRARELVGMASDAPLRGGAPPLA